MDRNDEYFFPIFSEGRQDTRYTDSTWNDVIHGDDFSRPRSIQTMDTISIRDYPLMTREPTLIAKRFVDRPDSERTLYGDYPLMTREPTLIAKRFVDRPHSERTLYGDVYSRQTPEPSPAQDSNSWIPTTASSNFNPLCSDRRLITRKRTPIPSYINGSDNYRSPTPLEILRLPEIKTPTRAVKYSSRLPTTQYNTQRETGYVPSFLRTNNSRQLSPIARRRIHKLNSVASPMFDPMSVNPGKARNRLRRLSLLSDGLSCGRLSPITRIKELKSNSAFKKRRNVACNANTTQHTTYNYHHEQTTEITSERKGGITKSTKSTRTKTTSCKKITFY